MYIQSQRIIMYRQNVSLHYCIRRFFSSHNIYGRFRSSLNRQDSRHVILIHKRHRRGVVLRTPLQEKLDRSPVSHISMLHPRRHTLTLEVAGTFPIPGHVEVRPVYTRVRLARDKQRRTIELLNNKTDPSLTNSIQRLSYLQTPTVTPILKVLKEA